MTFQTYWHESELGSVVIQTGVTPGHIGLEVTNGCSAEARLSTDDAERIAVMLLAAVEIVKMQQ